MSSEWTDAESEALGKLADEAYYRRVSQPSAASSGVSAHPASFFSFQHQSPRPIVKSSPITVTSIGKATIAASRHHPYHGNQILAASSSSCSSSYSSPSKLKNAPLTVYILKCQHNKFYVGKTKQAVADRFREHRHGRGSEFTRAYPPIAIAEEIPNADEFDEDKYVKKYMSKYGIDNVRGGSYSSLELDDAQQQSLQDELATAFDKCFCCGKSGHFAHQCQEAQGYWECEICGDEFDSEAACGRHEAGCRACFRCGRTSHWADACFARTHIKGYAI